MDTGCKAVLSLSIWCANSLSLSLPCSLYLKFPLSSSSLIHFLSHFCTSLPHMCTHYVFICWDCMTLTPHWLLMFLHFCNASPYSHIWWNQQTLMGNKSADLCLACRKKKSRLLILFFLGKRPKANIKTLSMCLHEGLFLIHTPTSSRSFSDTNGIIVH